MRGGGSPVWEEYHEYENGKWVRVFDGMMVELRNHVAGGVVQPILMGRALYRVTVCGWMDGWNIGYYV